MDGVVPVVVVVAVAAVPAAVIGLQHRMVPFVAGILPAYHHALAAVSHGPDAVRADLGQTPGHLLEAAQVLLLFLPVIGNPHWGVRGDVGHLGKGRHPADELDVPETAHHVHQVEGLGTRAGFTQQTQHGALRGLRLFLQQGERLGSLGFLALDTAHRREVGLLVQHDEEGLVLPRRSLFEYGRSDLVVRSGEQGAQDQEEVECLHGQPMGW